MKYGDDFNVLEMWQNFIDECLIHIDENVQVCCIFCFASLARQVCNCCRTLKQPICYSMHGIVCCFTLYEDINYMLFVN